MQEELWKERLPPAEDNSGMSWDAGRPVEPGTPGGEKSMCRDFPGQTLGHLWVMAWGSV